MIVDAAELEKRAAAVFMAKGMSADDAATVAQTLVWADLRGTASHGVARVPRYMEMIAAGEFDTCARPVIEEKGPSLVLMRANRAAGPVAMMAMAAEAEQRAKRTGCCIAIVSTTTHTGAIGRYAEWLAERGLASIIAAAGPPMMAYHGARVPSLSTSPIAMGVPRAGKPLVLDMATSIVALGKIKDSRQNDDPIPEGLALDDRGEPTTDPTRAHVALPLGGAKGSGLSLMIECLTSLMAGTPILSAMVGPQGDGRHRQNAFMVVIDIAAFGDPAAYAKDIEKLAGVIKGLPAQKGVEEILLPGERGSRAAAENRRVGVNVGNKVWALLSKPG